MPRSFNISLFILIIFLIILRFISLEIDPPNFFAGHTQAHLTDPYHLTFFARNAILFDDWNPFDFYRWDVFKYSLVSGFSYIVFSIAGISRITANLSAVLLSLAGIGFFVIGFYRLRSNRETLIMTGFLLLSSMLFFYGRLPFLENGLIFLSGLLFFVFIKTYDKWWGQLLSGFLVALATLSGKLFGLILLGPVILSLIYYYRFRAFIPSLRILFGCIIGMTLYVIVFFDGGLLILKNYYLEQTIGMSGTHPGLLSPLAMLKKLLTYGSTNGFFELSPFLLILAGFGLILILLCNVPKGIFKKESLPLIFSVAWILCGILSLMPFNYRPLRYTIFLFLPLSAMCAYCINLLNETKIKFRLHYKTIILVVILFIFWYISTQISMIFNPSGDARKYGIAVMPYTFIVSLLLSIAIAVWLRKGSQVVSSKGLKILIFPLLIALLVHQGMLLYQGMTQPGKYLKEYSREIGQLIDEKAVITGPYAPAFTIGNNLKGIIYHFGLSDIEHSLFEKYPITHITTDISNWDRGKTDFPILNQSIRLARFAVRDFPARFYRLPNAKIPLTDYEKGIVFLDREMPDSSLKYSKRFNDKYPKNLFGLFLLVQSYKAAGQVKPCFELVNKMVNENPDNYRVHLFCKNLYHEIYTKTGEDDFRKMAAHHYKRALELNPTLEKAEL